MAARKIKLQLVPAGFDGHVEEEMAHFMLLDEDYAWITRRLVDVAQHYAEGRIVSCLEGGYALSALGRSAIAHVKALIDQRGKRNIQVARRLGCVEECLHGLSFGADGGDHHP